jgi:hypothetical protein
MAFISIDYAPSNGTYALLMDMVALEEYSFTFNDVNRAQISMK